MLNNLIDKIFVINLKSQPERLEQFYRDMKDFGIQPDQIELFDAVYGEYGIGCTASHIEILKIAKRRDYKNVLIFEDDFKFLISKEKFDSKIKEFFNIYNLDWKVLMLSYNNINNEIKPFNDLIGITNNTQTTSGYLANSKYFDQLINFLSDGLQKLIETHQHWNFTIDQYWKHLQKDDKWFYFLERCGKQRPFYTKDGRYIDYNC
jgi:glycosyl transferase family 25